MLNTFLFIFIAFAAGFVTAWVLRTITLQKNRKSRKSIEGLLESERLMKEKLRKENIHVYQAKDMMEVELSNRLKNAEALTRMMDSDILLLQKSNEETEAMLKTAEPALHQLKLKLIEANNTIARYKAQMNRMSLQMKDAE